MHRSFLPEATNSIEDCTARAGTLSLTLASSTRYMPAIRRPSLHTCPSTADQVEPKSGRTAMRLMTDFSRRRAYLTRQ